MFEGRKPQARELVTIAVLCTIGVIGKIAFYMIPQFKPTVAIIIISAMALGSQRGFLIGVITAFVSNIFSPFPLIVSFPLIVFFPLTFFH